MLELSILIILFVGIVSYFCRLSHFNSLPKVQAEAFKNYSKIENGMSLYRINDILGKKGKKVFGSKNIYRWYFGDSICVKDLEGNPVPFTEFMNDIENRTNYRLYRGNSYIEIDFDSDLSNSKGHRCL